jgi:hypothetical protein
VTYTQARADAAVKVAAGLGVHGNDPVVLADGASVVVHLRPAPLVAKVAASTTAVRPAATWLQRELDVAQFLAARGAPVMTPSPEVPATVHHGNGQIMSFWQYLSPSGGVLAAYGEPVDPAQLTACEQLRRLHLAVWYNLYAERLPRLRPRAAELLTGWPPP